MLAAVLFLHYKPIHPPIQFIDRVLLLTGYNSSSEYLPWFWILHCLLLFQKEEYLGTFAVPLTPHLEWTWQRIKSNNTNTSLVLLMMYRCTLIQKKIPIHILIRPLKCCGWFFVLFVFCWGGVDSREWGREDKTERNHTKLSRQAAKHRSWHDCWVLSRLCLRDITSKTWLWLGRTHGDKCLACFLSEWKP